MSNSHKITLTNFTTGESFLKEIPDEEYDKIMTGRDGGVDKDLGDYRILALFKNELKTSNIEHV